MSVPSYRSLLLTYLSPLTGRVALLAALLFAGVGLRLLNPQIVRGFIDTARSGGGPSTLAAAALAFLGVALLTQLASVAETYVAANVGWLATNALRADLAVHCLGLDLTFHNRHTPGELIERVDGDVATLANFFSRFVLLVAGNFVLLLGILVLVTREDWRVGLLFTTSSAAGLTFAWWARRIGARYALAQRQASAELFGFLEERLGALPDVKAGGAQAYVLYRAEQALRNLFQRAQKGALVGGLLGARGLIDTAGWVAMLALTAWLFRRGEMTLGTVYLVMQYLWMLDLPLSQISRQIRDLQQAGAGVERIRDLLDAQPAVANTGRDSLPADPLAVEFDRVSFAYDERRTTNDESSSRAADSSCVLRPSSQSVLRDVSFALAPGEVLGLLGRTGSGKTTVARLVTRLYDAGAGRVLVGGRDVRQVDLDDLRRAVGFVTQDVQLFRSSVRDNVTLFDASIGDERVIDALEGLGLGDWLRRLPRGLDSVLSSEGSGPSAGEAQLLAFARVFLRDPGVVILDEASSRLDPSTERRVERAVDRLLGIDEGRGRGRPSSWGDGPQRGGQPPARRRTAILIAHRLETVQRADQILVLEDGAVAEYGPRATLAADPRSRYAGLLRAGSLAPLGAGGARRPVTEEVPA